MYDQADRLRQLVLGATRPNAAAQKKSPSLLVVSGGSAGVGTTTLAIELASQICRRGDCRVLLMDANFSHPELATRCGQVERGTLRDVLTGRRTINEVLLRGADGVQIVPGGRCEGASADTLSQQSRDRFLDQLRWLREAVDLVIVDAGWGHGENVQGFWQVATTILLVTTPDPNAILDGYAAIKAAAKRASPEKICVVANRIDSRQSDYGRIERRIRQTCHRFLGVAIDAGPSVPAEVSGDRAGRGHSLSLQRRWHQGPVLQVRGLAEHLARRLGLPNRPGELTDSTRDADGSRQHTSCEVTAVSKAVESAVCMNSSKKD